MWVYTTADNYVQFEKAIMKSDFQIGDCSLVCISGATDPMPADVLVIYVVSTIVLGTLLYWWDEYRAKKRRNNYFK